MVKMLLNSLLRRRSRIAVALIGIAIGATVLLGMITLCYDVPRQLGQEFRSYGANMIFMPAGRATSLSLDDVNLALALLPAEKILGATVYRYASARINLQPLTAAGTDFTQAAQTSPFWKIDGRLPSQDNEILIGADVAELTQLAPGMSALVSGRNKNRVGFNRPMLISGIVSSGGAEDGFIFMNMPAMESLQGNSGEADMVELSLTANEEELGNIAAAINGSMINIKAQLVKRITRSEASVLSKLESLVYLVTAVVLLLTMICVATTMMTIVMERRKEIGLKKAIGADSKNVGREFLAEGLIMGITGGLIGSVCGLIFAQLISDSVFARSINIEIYLIPLTLIISGIVTVLACLVPARRAMDVEPSVVLRGE
ncbi:MAG: FtsX-like permease family protein [Desulfarculales bacterium]|jgi:putative ABC transport system permease protein|nr:FtsX-like permease family protein [Desulfarculales bacterium]